MKRGSKSGGKLGGAERRKAASPRRHIPAKSATTRRSTENSQTEIARLSRERDEALEREKATAEVLRVISSSPGALEPVFQTILKKATSICEAGFGDIFRYDGKAFHFAARVDTPPALAEFQIQRGPFLPVEGGGMDRMMRTRQVIQVIDNAAEAVPTASGQTWRGSLNYLGADA